MSNKSLYKVIINDISSMLENGELRPGDKVPSVIELQSKYDVSHLTALKALKALSLEKRIEFEKGKGYFASVQGQRQLFGVVACLTRPSWKTNETDNYFNDINQSVENELMKKAFSTFHPWCSQLLMNSSPSREVLEQIKQKIIELNDSVDGFILDERISDTLIDEIKNKVSKPMVLVNRVSKAGIDSVSPDNFNGAIKAAEMCMKMGYRKFLVGHILQSMPNHQERTEGFISALTAAGIPNGKIIQFGFNLRSYEEEFAPCEKHIDSPEKTLIFSPLDVFARWAADMLSARGVRLGEKIGVMGFDAMLIASSKKPFLATMDVSPSQIGALAVEVLLGRINKTNLSAPSSYFPEAIFKMGETI